MLFKKMSLAKKSAWTGRAFILPWLIGFVFFFIKPMIESIYYSFTRIVITPTGISTIFIGVKNYHYAFLEDPEFIRNLVESLQNMLYEVPLIVFFSLFIAIILNQEFKGKTFARSMFFLPVIVASGVIIQLLKRDVLVQNIMSSQNSTASIFQSSVLEHLLMQAGINIELANLFTGAVNRLFDLTWRSGVQILLFLAGLQTIPSSLYEVSDIEGATAWESFWKITFPMVSPIILINVVYSVIDSFTDYGNKVMLMISEIAKNLKFEYSSTLTWIYFLCVFVIVGIVIGLVSRKVYYIAD